MVARGTGVSLMKALLFGKLKKAGKGCVEFDGKELVINC